MAKEEKADVDYSQGMAHSHCGPTFHDDRFWCQHFMPRGASQETGTCELVEGTIGVKMWCKLYKRIKK